MKSVAVKIVLIACIILMLSGIRRGRHVMARGAAGIAGAFCDQCSAV